MRTLRMVFVGGFAGALMASNVATLQAAPLPTNVASMRSMVADSLIQVRWGGWRAGGLRTQRFRRLGLSGLGSWRPNRWRDREQRRWLLWGRSVLRRLLPRLWRLSGLRRLLPRLQLLSGLRRLSLASNPRTRGR